METLTKHRTQYYLERGVPLVLATVISVSYFLTGRTDGVAFLTFFAGVAVFIACLAVRMPVKLSFHEDKLSIAYDRGADLAIPYDQMNPSIQDIQAMRIRYTNGAGKKTFLDLGSYWQKAGVSVSSIVVCEMLQTAAKKPFHF